MGIARQLQRGLIRWKPGEHRLRREMGVSRFRAEQADLLEAMLQGVGPQSPAGRPQRQGMAGGMGGVRALRSGQYGADSRQRRSAAVDDLAPAHIAETQAVEAQQSLRAGALLL